MKAKMKSELAFTGILLTTLIVLSILNGCAASDTRVAKKTAAPKPVDISGEWHAVGSTAVFNISFIDSAIRIEGWDSGSMEKFRISDVYWNGRHLNGIFVLPSTKKTHYPSLALGFRH